MLLVDVWRASDVHGGRGGKGVVRCPSLTLSSIRHVGVQKGMPETAQNGLKRARLLFLANGGSCKLKFDALSGCRNVCRAFRILGEVASEHRKRGVDSADSWR